MNLEGIATILQDAGVGVVGKSIFINFMPADKSGILLRDPFGATPIDYELDGYRKTGFMLVVRDKLHETAKTLMKSAMDALTIEDKVAAGMKINYMRPRTEPFFYAPSPGQNVEVVTNIDCCYVIL